MIPVKGLLARRAYEIPARDEHHNLHRESSTILY